jgi:hypothetical protein
MPAPEIIPTTPELPTREYPFAHDLREGINRSHRRIDILNIIQAVLGVLALIACAVALFLL